MIKKFNDFIKESYNNNLGFINPKSDFYLINESQESQSQKEAIKLVMDRFGWDKEKANNFVRVDLRNDITPLRDKQIGKFTLGVTRMYCNSQLKDAKTISDLNATLKLLSAHLNEYDRNLNGLSVDELISKFQKNRENDKERKKREIKKLKFGTSDYEIVKIDSYNDAKKYYEYTNPNSRWCLTHMENMYNSYTCDGINQIYFCLKNGFEDIKPVVGENAPLDEYGLSMISIIVNEDEELAYCTCRWNHDNGGTDSIMDEIEVSKVVNVDFFETFKPNTKWKDMIGDAKQRLKNGELPKIIFDQTWEYNEGYMKVKLNKKYNFIDKNGEFLSDKWFDETYFFKEGCVLVCLNKKYNYIDKNGEYLFDKWFDNADVFSEGYASIGLNNKYNFIDKNGEYLSDKWFDETYNFKEGYARVRLKDKYNIIDKNGEILSDVWFEDTWDFSEGYVKVRLKNNDNFIDKNGEYLSDKWFDFAGSFNEGYAKVKLKDKYNFIDKNGEYLSDKWFDYVFNFKEGYAMVRLKDTYNYINKNGELLSDKWFDETYDFKEDFARVKLKDKYNFIDKNGKLQSDVYLTFSEANKYFNKHLKK